MQVRTIQQTHYPLPDVLQDIVLSYLDEEDEEERQEFISSTKREAKLWMKDARMAAHVIFSDRYPWYTRVCVASLGLPGTLLGGLVYSLLWSPFTVPLDISRYTYRKISDTKNQRWASFFVDVERMPKHFVSESLKIPHNL